VVTVVAEQIDNIGLDVLVPQEKPPIHVKVVRQAMFKYPSASLGSAEVCKIDGGRSRLCRYLLETTVLIGHDAPQAIFVDRRNVCHLGTGETRDDLVDGPPDHNPADAGHVVIDQLPRRRRRSLRSACPWKRKKIGDVAHPPKSDRTLVVALAGAVGQKSR